MAGVWLWLGSLSLFVVRTADAVAEGFDPATAPFAEASARDDLHWRQLLREEKFAELDAIAGELRTSNAKYRDGRSRLWRLYINLGELNRDQPTELAYQERINVLTKWRKQSPKSPTAGVALARLWADFGFFARGDGYADTVSEDASHRLEERCRKAKTILDEVDGFAPRDLGYYRTRIDLASGLGEKPDRQLVYEALEKDPLNLEATHGMAVSLLPRWFGEPGELEDFAVEVANRTKKVAGDLHYARVAQVTHLFEGELLFDAHQFEWPRIKRGIADWERLYPLANEQRPEFARLAVFAGDFPAANDYSDRLGPTPSYSSWGNKAGFIEWKKRLDPALHSGDHVRLFVPCDAGIALLGCTPDGSIVATVSSTKILRFHELATGEKRGAVRLDGLRIASASLSMNRGLLAVGLDDAPGVLLMELGTGRTQHLDVLTGPALLTHFAPDGKSLAAAMPDARISVISLETGKPIAEIPGVAERVVQTLAFSPDGKSLAATTRSGLIQVFEAATGKEQAQWLPGAGWPMSMAWSPEGDRIAVGNRESILRVFQWPGGDLIKSWKADIPVVDSLSFSTDGRQLLIGLTARQKGQKVKQPVRLWDYQNDSAPKGLTGHQFGVPAVAFLPDGQLLTASFDWTVRSWKPDAAKK